MFAGLLALGAVLLILSLLAPAVHFLLWVGVALILCGLVVMVTEHTHRL